MYETLLAKFGTHYLESGFFGGHLLMKADIERHYAQSHEQFDLLQSVKGALLRELRTPNAPPVPADFRNASQLTSRIYGGLALASRPWKEWLTKWAPGLIINPVLLSGQLSSIDTLIAHPQIALEVGKAIALKKARAYLAELRHIIKMGHFTLSTLERTLLNKAELAFEARRVKDIPLLTRLLRDVFARLEMTRRN